VDSPVRAREPRHDERADEVHFEQIYRRHVAFVWRSLRSLGVPETALEDATHEVFVVLYRRWGDWDGRSKMTTWLYGIAKGVARNAFRTQQRAERRVRGLERDVVSDGPAWSDPSERMERERAARLLEGFLEGLVPDQRQVFELCAIEGLSVPQAAACLELNLNTAATRLRRARQRFAEFVDRLDGHTP